MGGYSVLLLAAVVLALLAATTTSAREVPAGGHRYEPEQQHVSVEHGVPSSPNHPGFNIMLPRLPLRYNNGAARYKLKQYTVSKHERPEPGVQVSNMSPYFPPRYDGTAARYELEKQHVSINHDVPSGPNPGSNMSPLLPPPRYDGAAALPAWRQRALLHAVTPVADDGEKLQVASA